jgi:hypothetical protein
VSLQKALSLLLAFAGRTDTGGLRFLTGNGAAVRIVYTTNASNERTAVTFTPSARS